MRRQLIEALTYPRLLVLNFIDEKDCPHANLFDATSERCHGCDINKECHWVSCLNMFGDFDDKPTYTINASLRYGIKLVESVHSELHHDETVCTCEPCAWVRDAQRLTEEFEPEADLKKGSDRISEKRLDAVGLTLDFDVSAGTWPCGNRGLPSSGIETCPRFPQIRRFP